MRFHTCFCLAAALASFLAVTHAQILGPWDIQLQFFSPADARVPKYRLVVHTDLVRNEGYYKGDMINRVSFRIHESSSQLRVIYWLT